MPRMTITLTEERHRALKEAAARRGKSIRELIDESLESYGIRSERSAREIVAAARARAGMTEAEALDLAVAETAAQRGG